MMEIWPNAGAAKVEAANRGANNHFTFIVLLRVWSQVCWHGRNLPLETP